MPASFDEHVKPLKMEMAPPWLKPPSGSQRGQHYVPGHLYHREPLTKDDAMRGDAFFGFGFDEGVEVVAGFQNAGFVVGLSELAESGLRTSQYHVIQRRIKQGLNDSISGSYYIVPPWHCHPEVLFAGLVSIEFDNSDANPQTSHIPPPTVSLGGGPLPYICPSIP